MPHPSPLMIIWAIRLKSNTILWGDCAPVRRAAAAPRQHNHKRVAAHNRSMGLIAASIILVAFQSNFYERGLKALEEKRYQEAADDFVNAIAAESKDYALHF